MKLVFMHICGRCDGSGQVPAGPGASATCPACDGAGELYWGHADALMDELDEVDAFISAISTELLDVKRRVDEEYHELLRTYLIYEATKESEWVALSDNNKTRYRLIIASGVTSLLEGTKTRNDLWAMFPEGTETRANLEALIGE